MRRRDGGDQRHMRADKRDQIADLAEMIHADLEHAIFGVARQRCERQRHAPMIVVGRGARHGCGPAHCSSSRSISLVVVLPALPVTARILALLRARAARARSSSPRWVSATVSKRSGDAVGRVDDQRRARLGVERGAHEIMAVAIVAFQRHEQIAFLQGAGVDGKPVHGKGLAGLAQGGGFGFGGGPQRHAARPPNASGRLHRFFAVGERDAPRRRHIGRSHGPCPPAPAHRPPASAGDAGADGLARGRRSRARRARRPEFPCGWRQGLRCGDCRR